MFSGELPSKGYFSVNSCFWVMKRYWFFFFYKFVMHEFPTLSRISEKFCVFLVAKYLILASFSQCMLTFIHLSSYARHRFGHCRFNRNVNHVNVCKGCNKLHLPDLYYCNWSIAKKEIDIAVQKRVLVSKLLRIYYLNALQSVSLSVLYWLWS